MQKGWSILFGVVLGAIFLLTALSPVFKWWLPTQVASFGGDVDYLFYVILFFTGFFFVLTEAILVYVMYRYAYRPGHKADYVEGNHRLELAWTIVPAAILLFIAFAQIKAWEEIKYASKMEDKQDLIVEVMGRQWEWRFRHPRDTARYQLTGNESDAEKKERRGAARKWSETPQIDDLRYVTDLHVYKEANVRIYLKTQDVLHSFFLPNLRLKQDALPGKTIPMWFRALESNTVYDEQTKTWKFEPGKEWEIACAELCGGGHYRMRGRLFVHADKADFERWLAHELALQNSHKPESIGKTPVAVNK